MNSRSITRITHWAALIGHQELRVRSSQPNDVKPRNLLDTSRLLDEKWNSFLNTLISFFFKETQKDHQIKTHRGVCGSIWFVCVFFSFMCVCDGEMVRRRWLTWPLDSHPAAASGSVLPPPPPSPSFFSSSSSPPTTPAAASRRPNGV